MPGEAFQRQFSVTNLLYCFFAPKSIYLAKVAAVVVKVAAAARQKSLQPPGKNPQRLLLR